MYDLMGYEEYKNYVRELTSKNESKKSYGNRVLVPARRFLLGQTISSEHPIPIPLAGYTIITPPKKEDDGNGSAYEKLGKAKDALSRIAGIVVVPEDVLHMTIADLISESSYERLLMNEQDNLFINAVRVLFERLRKNRVLFPKVEMHIKGLGLFPDCIVAVLMPATEDGYRSLREFRHFVYSESAKLKELGIKGESRYAFHITLAYFESYLDKHSRDGLTNALASINEKYFANPISFVVYKAQLAKFEDMSSFSTSQGGIPLPSFEFSKPTQSKIA